MRSAVGLVLLAFACGVASLQMAAALPAYPRVVLGAALLIIIASGVARARWRVERCRALIIIVAGMVAMRMGGSS